VQCPATPFITQLESKLCGTSGLDAVLAALIAHAQQNAATGSKLAPGALAPASSKQEVLEVSSLSAVQEHHSSARALPLLIRLYFNTGSRAEVRGIASGDCVSSLDCAVTATISPPAPAQLHGDIVSLSPSSRALVV
jgi:hypothetical protein